MYLFLQNLLASLRVIQVVKQRRATDTRLGLILKFKLWCYSSVSECKTCLTQPCSRSRCRVSAYYLSSFQSPPCLSGDSTCDLDSYKTLTLTPLPLHTSAWGAVRGETVSSHFTNLDEKQNFHHRPTHNSAITLQHY